MAPGRGYRNAIGTSLKNIVAIFLRGRETLANKAKEIRTRDLEDTGSIPHSTLDFKHYHEQALAPPWTSSSPEKVEITRFPHFSGTHDY